MTDDDLRILGTVNRSVNRLIRPRLEPPSEDVWRIEPEYGDCEDYAVTKKHALISKGWSADRLRFATVITETGEYHAVLLVDAASGTLLLDNRFDEVKPLSQARARGYVLVGIEGAGPGGRWKVMPDAGLALLLLLKPTTLPIQ